MENIDEVENRPRSISRGRNYRDPPPAPLIDAAELRKWSLYRAVIAEYIATTLFLYVTIMTVIGYRDQSDPIMADDSCNNVGVLGIAWCFGGMTFLLVYSTAGISGGHINPAVTLGLLIARKVTLARAVMYMVAQWLGSLTGVGGVKLVQGAITYSDAGGGVNVVADGYDNDVALGAEIIGTFVLVYVALSATDPKRDARDSYAPVLAPFPIGFIVFMVHLATIPITGTSINPARSLATTIVYRRQKPWHDQWIFWVGPLTGATIAAFYNKFMSRGGTLKS